MIKSNPKYKFQDIRTMSIIDIFQKFPNEESCISYLEGIRWGNGVKCAYCGSEKTCVHASTDKKAPRWQCQECSKAFSVTVGTIFHGTRLPLKTWFLAISIIMNAKKGLSSRQLSRDLSLPVKTGYSLYQRIRKAMIHDTLNQELFNGIVEMDESYLGGKPRKFSGKANKRGRGTDKLPVVGIVERHGKVKALSMKKEDLTFKGLQEIVKEGIDLHNSMLMTDQYKGYSKMRTIIEHRQVNHEFEYVNDGYIHTNTIESFWSLLKRAWMGQHHHYSKTYAMSYIAETSYKYNNRRNADSFKDTINLLLKVA